MIAGILLQVKILLAPVNATNENKLPVKMNKKNEQLHVQMNNVS